MAIAAASVRIFFIRASGLKGCPSWSIEAKAPTSSAGNASAGFLLDDFVELLIELEVVGMHGIELLSGEIVNVSGGGLSVWERGKMFKCSLTISQASRYHHS